MLPWRRIAKEDVVLPAAIGDMEPRMTLAADPNQRVSYRQLAVGAVVAVQRW